jgi:hypothetical protein
MALRPVITLVAVEASCVFSFSTVHDGFGSAAADGTADGVEGAFGPDPTSDGGDANVAFCDAADEVVAVIEVGNGSVGGSVITSGEAADGVDGAFGSGTLSDGDGGCAAAAGGAAIQVSDALGVALGSDGRGADAAGGATDGVEGVISSPSDAGCVDVVDGTAGFNSSDACESCITAVVYEDAGHAERKVGSRTASAGDVAGVCEAAGDIECEVGSRTASAVGGAAMVCNAAGDFERGMRYRT